MSKIIAIGERAWLRAAERGDTAAMDRAESWLRRATAEQDSYDAAEMAGLENEQAMRQLADIYRRDNP
jgi:hypothetical protein